MRALFEILVGTVQDLEEVAHLCILARNESATPAQICSADTERLKGQLGVLLSVEGGRIFVARQDGIALGFILARLIETNIYNDDPVLYIEALYVDQQHRRQGVGHALLTSAARLASDSGAVEVYSVPIPGSRGVQRFLARMGFAPAAAHRVVATSVLLRKLEADGSPNRRATRGLEDLIARRRKARIETQSGPVDLRGFHAELASRAEPAKPAVEGVAKSQSEEPLPTADELFELEATVEFPNGFPRK